MTVFSHYICIYIWIYSLKFYKIKIISPGTTPVSATPLTQPRRRSIYNFPFFLRHQDAIETPDERTSPIPVRKEMKPSGTSQSLHPAMAEDPKPKRGSIIRRKRVGSVKARPTSVATGSGCQRTQSEKCSSTDVSILVTEASPESTVVRPPLHRQNSEATVVQVLVHRESEEYNTEEESAPAVQVTQSEPVSNDNVSTDVVLDLSSTNAAS